MSAHPQPQKETRSRRLTDSSSASCLAFSTFSTNALSFSLAPASNVCCLLLSCCNPPSCNIAAARTVKIARLSDPTLISSLFRGKNGKKRGNVPERPLGIELLLERRQQVGTLLDGGSGGGGFLPSGYEPGVLQRLVRGEAGRRIDGEAAADEVAG